MADDLKTRGARLRFARKRAGLTVKEAAERLGLAVSTIQSKEAAQQQRSNTRDFSFEEAETFARIYGIDAMWLYARKGKEPNNIKRQPAPEPEQVQPAKQPTSLHWQQSSPCKVVGYVGASTGEGALYGLADADFDEVNRPMIPAKAVAVEIRGRSFGPLMDGMLVFYEDVRRPVTDDLIGSICVVGLRDSRILLKKVVRNPAGGWRLLSNVPEEKPIDVSQIEWAAPMIAITPR